MREKENNDFCLIQQKNMIDNLIMVGDKHLKNDNEENIYKISTDFVVVTPNNKKLKTSTKQFLLYILSKATEQNLNKEDRSVIISIHDFAQYRKINNINKIRTKVKEDISTLISLQLMFIDKRKLKNKEIQQNMQLNVCSQISTYKKGNIFIVFTPEFIEYYRSLSIMQLPKEIFEIDTRYNPNSVNMLWKLCYHHNLNYTKSNSNIISVRTLLKFCPNLPDYDSVLKNSGQIMQRLITPFERDLDALNIIDWYYLDENSISLSKGKKRIADFLNAKIVFSIKGY